jgi:large subunit ribosomal protein L14
VVLILRGSFFGIYDNSGGKSLKLLTGYPGSRFSGVGYPGQLLLGLVKKALPHKKVKRGDKLKAVLVQTKTYCTRTSGNIKSARNVVVLLRKNDILPFANRIYVRLFMELRFKGYFRVGLISRGFC